MNENKGRLLRGAKEIAGYLLGNEDLYKSVYPLADELKLFTLGGLICGETETIDAVIAAKTQAPASERLAMRRDRQASFPRREKHHSPAKMIARSRASA